MRLRKVTGFLIAFGVAGMAVADEPAPKGDKGRIGLTATVDGSLGVGVQYFLTDRLAVRPNFAFDHNSSDATTSTTDSRPVPLPPGPTESDSHQTRFIESLSLVYYLGKVEEVKPYLGVSYSHTSNTTDAFSTTNQTASLVLPGQRVPTLVPEELDQSTHSDGHGNAGALFFGAQRAFGRRFSAFAQAGVSYGSTTTDQTIDRTMKLVAPNTATLETTLTTKAHIHSNSTASFTGAVGLIFYFN